MKLLIMCEGPNELAIVKMLLDASCFKFSRNELLGLVPFHARQLSSTAVRTNLNQYAGPVKVLRIGDTLTDTLKISKDDQEKIKSVEKYCTKPELEMLLIIAEGLTAEFEKVKAGKGRMSPKEFSKAHIAYNHVRYNNTTKFFVDYFQSDIEKLTATIRAYKAHNGAHKKDEGYLADLLK